MIMRCLQCSRDYPDGHAFCHQCGEALHRREPSGDPAARRERPAASVQRARIMARRRAPGHSQSFLFAAVVLVAAGVGLAVVTRQAWMPSRPSVTANPPRQEAPAPPPAVAPAPAPEPAPAEAQPVAPATAPESATAAATPPPAPPARAVRAPEPGPPPAPAPVVAKRAPEPAAPAATPKVAPRPEPAPPVERPAPAASAPKLLSARTDPGVAVPPSGARVIAMVPVGAAPRARGQLLWEPVGGGTLVVSGLPQPPAGRTYQLWLGSINLGNRVSAGLLAVDAQGAGTLRVAPPRATWSPDIFGVTMERQGGAREPSDELVLVGELAKATAAASAAPLAPPDTAAGNPPAPAPDATPPPAPAPPVTASLPPAATRGSDGHLGRVFAANQERSWMVAQSALRSLGWDIDSADQASGVIRTEPRNVTFKDFVLYAEGTRHVLSVVVRPVSSSETSIAVRRDVFEEKRIFWAKERKLLPVPESSVEQNILDAIERLL
jgi:hypothetical protein